MISAVDSVPSHPPANDVICRCHDGHLVGRSSRDARQQPKRIGSHLSRENTTINTTDQHQPATIILASTSSTKTTNNNNGLSLTVHTHTHVRIIQATTCEDCRVASPEARSLYHRFVPIETPRRKYDTSNYLLRRFSGDFFGGTIALS